MRSMNLGVTNQQISDASGFSHPSLPTQGGRPILHANTTRHNIYGSRFSGNLSFPCTKGEPEPRFSKRSRVGSEGWGAIVQEHSPILRVPLRSNHHKPNRI